MANLKNAKKAIRVIAKKKAINNEVSAKMKTSMKKLEKAIKAGDKAEATELLNITIKRLDTACSKGVCHKNFSSRNKSRLSKKVNEMK